jgi:branched-chain amino acid transport system substrate-binding protein
VLSLLTAEPEYLIPLGEETPEGWIVTGYPVESLHDAANAEFIQAYTERFKQAPRMGSVVGAALIAGIAAGIAKAGGTGAEAMAEGFAGARFATPFGTALWRAQDHQSTLGTFVGRTALRDGRGAMVDWRYVDGAAVMPSDAEVRRLRPA